MNNKLSQSNKKLHKRLVKGKINKNAVIYIAIRAKKYDKYVVEFTKRYPKATIVNIGCGLDNRFERIDNGEIEFYDLDLQDIIDIKEQLFKKTERYHYISQSVFDFSWIKNIAKNDILFLAEGVFMYCNEKDVKSLFLKLQSEFPGSEIVCEVLNSMWLKGWLKKMINFKLQKKMYLGKDATFNFGIKDSNEIENWNEGIKLIGDWGYFDSNEKKLGWLKVFRHIELLRKMQWTVHYKLDKEPNA